VPKCPFCEKSISPDTTECPHCHAPIAGTQPPPSGDLDQRVRELLDQRQKIAAIKLYREETGAGLLEAKNAVEALASGSPLPGQDRPIESDLEADILRLLKQGEKISAIKLYREQTGCGLKDAKDAVEALGEKHGIASQRSGGEGGCMGIVLVVLSVALTVASIGSLMLCGVQ